MDENIRRLKEIVDGSDNIVFFGGAGVSTESGIPDFRSVDGLYNQQYAYPPETIISHSFFMKNHPFYIVNSIVTRCAQTLQQSLRFTYVQHLPLPKRG